MRESPPSLTYVSPIFSPFLKVGEVVSLRSDLSGTTCFMHSFVHMVGAKPTRARRSGSTLTWRALAPKSFTEMNGAMGRIGH